MRNGVTLALVVVGFLFFAAQVREVWAIAVGCWTLAIVYWKVTTPRGFGR